MLNLPDIADKFPSITNLLPWKKKGTPDNMVVSSFSQVKRISCHDWSAFDHKTASPKLTRRKRLTSALLKDGSRGNALRKTLNGSSFGVHCLGLF